jgi:hypothetical protein
VSFEKGIFEYGCPGQHLQHMALPQDNASEEIIPLMIGSLGCDPWMTASNYNASLTCKGVETQAEWKRHQHLVTKLCNKLACIIDIKATPNHPQRLIIPMVSSPPGLIGHFFVACFDFSVHHPNFLVDIVAFYDSLERVQKRIKQASTCASMVKKVNMFSTNTFCTKGSTSLYNSQMPTCLDKCSTRILHCRTMGVIVEYLLLRQHCILWNKFL